MVPVGASNNLVPGYSGGRQIHTSRLGGGAPGAPHPELGDLGQLLALLGLSLLGCEFGTILPACERMNREVFAFVHFHVFALKIFIQCSCLLGPVLSPRPTEMRCSWLWPSRLSQATGGAG